MSFATGAFFSGRFESVFRHLAIFGINGIDEGQEPAEVIAGNPVVLAILAYCRVEDRHFGAVLKDLSIALQGIKRAKIKFVPETWLVFEFPCLWRLRRAGVQPSLFRVFLSELGQPFTI